MCQMFWNSPDFTYILYLCPHKSSSGVWDPIVTVAPRAAFWSEGQFCLSLQELHSDPQFYSAKAKRLDLCQGLVGKSAQLLETHAWHL